MPTLGTGPVTESVPPTAVGPPADPLKVASGKRDCPLLNVIDPPLLSSRVGTTVNIICDTVEAPLYCGAICRRPHESLASLHPETSICAPGESTVPVEPSTTGPSATMLPLMVTEPPG